MELKPEKKNREPKYPNEDEIDKKWYNRPAKKWEKIGLTAATLGILGTVGIGATIIVMNVEEPLGGAAYVETTEERIMMFNARFTSYEGQIRGDMVRNLTNQVLYDNSKELRG